MTRRCDTPISRETLVAYWARGLPPDQEDAVEQHVLGCDACAMQSARVAEFAESIGLGIPPLLVPEALGQLRARGLRVIENPVAPGAVSQAVLGPGEDAVVHRLGGLVLGSAANVSFELRDEHTGEVQLSYGSAPFDRASGEVLLSCQRHDAAFPHDLVAEIRVTGPDGTEVVSTYTLRHVFG